MPDSTLSQAIKEAYAACPADSIIHHTLEIHHPSFTTPIRVVRDNNLTPLTATLEATAPRDAGQAVNFVGYQFDLTPPEVSTTGVPQCTVEIDNVSREILQQIELAVAGGSPDLITIIYRSFLSDDLTGPQNDPPLTLTVSDITANVFRIQATAGFPNLANKRFPSQDYTSERFPGLIGQ